MKKLMFVLVAVFVCLSIASCGKKNAASAGASSQGASSSVGSAQSSSVANAANAVASGNVAASKEGGYIIPFGEDGTAYFSIGENEYFVDIVESEYEPDVTRSFEINFLSDSLNIEFDYRSLSSYIVKTDSGNYYAIVTALSMWDYFHLSFVFALRTGDVLKNLVQTGVWEAYLEDADQNTSHCKMYSDLTNDVIDMRSGYKYYSFTDEGLVAETDYYLFDFSMEDFDEYGSYVVIQEIECDVYDKNFQPSGKKEKLHEGTHLALCRMSEELDYVDFIDKDGKIYHFTVENESTLNGVPIYDVMDRIEYGE